MIASTPSGQDERQSVAAGRVAVVDDDAERAVADPIAVESLKLVCIALACRAGYEIEPMAPNGERRSSGA